MNKSVSDKLAFPFVAVAILGFSSIPFLLGKSAETDALAFRGTYTDTADYAVHLAMMQAGRLGEWAYQLRFTSEEHNPAFIRLFYILLGHLSRLLNLDVETVFHAARWLFGLTALFAFDRLFHKAFPQKAHARFAFFLAVLGGGVGWLQLILGAPLEPISPIDLWLIDAYILFSISLFPAFSFTLTLMAAALYFFLQFLEDGEWRNVVWVSLLAVTSQMMNPIAFAVVDLSMAGAVLFTWWKHRKIDFKQGYALLLIAVVQVPLLLYNLWVLALDPIWSQFTRQNETLSPPLIFYLWGFAPFWLFAIVGIIRSLRERNPAMGAMSVWVAGGFFLAYLPVLIQRRFLLGVPIPLGALAIYGFQFLMAKLPASLQALKRRESLLCFTYVLFASVSSLFLILNSSLYVLTQPKALFYPREIQAAAQWLDENAAPGDFVLADVQTSQILAQRTRLKVYVGHEMETLYFHNKESAMKAYFNGTISAEWLSQTPVRWVVYGPYEAEINASFLPDSTLTLVHQNDAVKIYEVNLER
ncbi:MAG: hypothetical protein HND47_21080 [Chloroflexi bacterium]|nr:hypothetical protein [Chloroflexota bacterium]